MAVVVDLTESAIFTAVRTFLKTIVAPGVEVVQGQANKVPSPISETYIVFWATWRNRLATTVTNWDKTNPTPATLQAQQSTQLDIQLQIHGATGADIGQAITTLWRSPYACEFLAPSRVSPLYCDEGRQAPFTNDQDQTEQRWILTLSMQVNPVVSTPQQFADTVTIDLINVDAVYPPEA